jgi:ComF family protein
MWQLFLDLFFPRRSLTGSEGAWITEEERRRLVPHPVIEEAADLRRRGIRSLDRLVAASTYADSPLLKKAIRTFKYGRIAALDKELAQFLLKALPVLEQEQPVLCPVPLHWMRRFQRGFNQSQRLARLLAEARGLAMLPLLRRIRWTGSQALRSRGDRLTAMGGAFRCTTDDPPSFIVLIDDLSTTGTTLDACARTLKEAGVRRVEGWVVAHDQKRT